MWLLDVSWSVSAGNGVRVTFWGALRVGFDVSNSSDWIFLAGERWAARGS